MFETRSAAKTFFGNDGDADLWSVSDVHCF